MYDVVIVGAGPGGIFTAYELLEKRPDLSIAVFEMGNELTKRHCPIDGYLVWSFLLILILFLTFQVVYFYLLLKFL